MGGTRTATAVSEGGHGDLFLLTCSSVIGALGLSYMHLKLAPCVLIG